MASQHCPICKVEVHPNKRYPRYVCDECASQACSVDGRLLKFSNIDIGGGFVARYADSGEEHPGHDCKILGIKCHADESRFGGIVIQPVDGEAES